MSPIPYAERDRIFGPPCSVDRLESYATPWGLQVKVHRIVRERLKAACAEASSLIWKPRRIDSYACRKVRGSNNWSLHAYGLAWDFFDRPYPEAVDVWGPTNAPPFEFREVFRRHGFRAGALYSGRKDYPHLEWAEGLPAATPYVPPPSQQPIYYPEDDMISVDGRSTQLDDAGRGAWFDVEGGHGQLDPRRVLRVKPNPQEDGYVIPAIETYDSGGHVRFVCKGGTPRGRVDYRVFLLESQ